MAELSVGIVGCGFRATSAHLPFYRKTNVPVSVDCVCDLDRSLATRAAAEFDVPRVYDDLSLMLDAETLDIVDVCVPPQEHAHTALAAIRAGCHVLVEKPLALTVAACDELLAAAEEHGVTLGVMHNMSYNKPFAAAKRRVAAGDIGTLSGVQILLTNPRADLLEKAGHWYHDLPGGLMTETLPHISYLALDLMDSVDEVSVTAKQVAGFEWAPHDEFELLFENPSVACSTRLSYSGRMRTMRVDVLGTEGHLQVDMLDNALYTHSLTSLDVLSLGRHSVGQLGQRAWNLSDNIHDVVTRRAVIGSNVVLGDFVESILEGRRPLTDGEGGRRAVAVLEKTIASYESRYGREQPVDRAAG